MVDADKLLSWRLVSDSDRSYLALAGELDMAASPELKRAVEAVAAAARPVTIDLDDVTFLDGGGLHALMALAQQVADVGLVATFGRYPKPVSRYLDLTGRTLATG